MRPPNTSVLYFHGFASSPKSAKVTALRPLLAEKGIAMQVPDLNVPSFARLDFEEMAALAVAEARRLPPAAMVGSSLGALVALAAAQHGIAVPLVLIAPALGVAPRWKNRIPEGDPVLVFNHATGSDAPIHRAFFEQMAGLHVDDDPPPSRVTAIMGRKDQTVPFEIVEETWMRWEASGRLVPGSRLVVVEEGDHELTGEVPRIAAAIEEAVR